jgi:riboflavin kinase/FMN adenylyltransferase
MVMGVFDGVHRGHLHLLDATVRAARAHGVASVALVFDPHPDEVLRPGHLVSRLTPPQGTLDLIRANGVGHAVLLRFDDGLRNLEPVAFLDALSPAIELRAVLMTPESAFGRRRAGTLELMRTVGPERGFEAIAVEPLLDGGEPISSSRARDAVEAGDLAAAARLLGRSHRLLGTTSRHESADAFALHLDYRPCLPPAGTYLCRWSADRTLEASPQTAVARIGPDGVQLRLAVGQPTARGTLELLERLDAPTLEDGAVEAERGRA